MDFLVLAFSLLPTFLIAWYLFKKTSAKDVSLKLCIALFIAGASVVFPVGVLEVNLASVYSLFGESDSFIGIFIQSFIIIALVEELAKWICTKSVIWKKTAFFSRFSGITYSVITALGFATFENIFYCFNQGIYVALVRMVSAVPTHVCDGLVMGLFLGQAKLFEKRNEFKRYKISTFLSLAIPALMHGFYDFCALQMNTAQNKLWLNIWITFVVFMFFICWQLLHYYSKHDVVFNFYDGIITNNVKKCPNCNVSVFRHNQFCPHCGFQLIDYQIVNQTKYMLDTVYSSRFENASYIQKNMIDLDLPGCCVLLFFIDNPNEKYTNYTYAYVYGNSNIIKHTKYILKQCIPLHNYYIAFVPCSADRIGVKMMELLRIFNAKLI